MNRPDAEKKTSSVYLEAALTLVQKMTPAGAFRIFSQLDKGSSNSTGRHILPLP